jgi:hypothetical protein
MQETAMEEDTGGHAGDAFEERASGQGQRVVVLEEVHLPKEERVPSYGSSYHHCFTKMVTCSTCTSGEQEETLGL